MDEERPAALSKSTLLPVRRGLGDLEYPAWTVPGCVPELRKPDLHAGGYAELLRRVPWQQFWTLTFRISKAGRGGGVHGESADKAFRFFVSCINRELYGPKWSTRWHRGIQWARGQEFHRDGRLHFHAVAAAPDGDLNRRMSRYQWHEFWYREFGRNRIEAPRSQADITGYVSKYVTKGGEVDFSKNFGAWMPPPIDFTASPEQHALIQAASNTGSPGGLMQASRNGSTQAVPLVPRVGGKGGS